MGTSPARKKAAPPKKAPATKKPAAPAKKRAGIVMPTAKSASAKKAAPREAKALAPALLPAVEKSQAIAPTGSAITERQQRFVDEYLIDLNGTQAAIRAGYSATTASEQSYDLLRKPQIWVAITAARKAQQERTRIDADRVVLEAWRVMTADARELVQVKIGCCRYCWGEGHRRQRTLSEYNSDRDCHRAKGKADEDWEEEGGIGYNPLRDPHAGCPDCHGDGCPRTVLGDTRHLSRETLALYAGAKQTKYGIEVLMHDKGAAMEKLFKHLGLYEKDNQQKTDPLAALLHAIASSNSNGFRPLAADPERPEHERQPSAFMPKADDGRGDDWRG